MAKIEFTISEEMITSDISSDAVFLYIMLKYYIFTNRKFNSQLFNLDLGCWLFNIDFKKRTNRELVKKAFNELINHNYIDCLEYASNKYELKEIKNDTCKYFIKVSEQTCLKFRELHSNKKTDMFRYYCHILKSRNYKYDRKVCDLSVNFLSELINISKSTIIRYNRLLEENKIIYIKRPTYNDKDKSVDLIGDYDDKGFVDKIANELKYGNSKQVGNQHRSISAKYNSYVRNPSKYDEEDEYKLYEQVKAYNDEMDDIQKMYAGSDYISRKKDLSVFPFEECDELFD